MAATIPLATLALLQTLEDAIAAANDGDALAAADAAAATVADTKAAASKDGATALHQQVTVAAAALVAEINTEAGNPPATPPARLVK